MEKYLNWWTIKSSFSGFGFLIGKHCVSPRFLGLGEAERMARGAAPGAGGAEVLPEYSREGLVFPPASRLHRSLADKIKILHFSS